jgi:hypothetical protein
MKQFPVYFFCIQITNLKKLKNIINGIIFFHAKIIIRWEKN